MKNLRTSLEDLRKENRASFHMPGHKYGGCNLKDTFNSFWDIDVTEIPGSDNLHDPEDILLEAKQRAQSAYGAAESFFLVNGSSCGIMAMILGTVKRGEKIVISRDAHRSVHQAVALGGLHPIYMMPQIDETTGIAIGLNVSALEMVLDENPDIRAVVCTYPSYSGACVDLPLIREMTRQKGVKLLVDEAHGAHLWLSEQLPPSAVGIGADAVVQSLHKTMPAMTQTAILHLGESLANRDSIAYYLTVFQTSSPSYVLMASIDEAIAIGQEMGKEAMKVLLDRCRTIRESGAALGFQFWDHLYFKEKGAWHFDDTKICISGHPLGLDGYALDELLRSYGIQSEYAVRSHVLLMSSIASTGEDFHRLEEVLKRISREKQAEHTKCLELEAVHDDFLHLKSEMAILPGDAANFPLGECSVDEAEAKVCADWIIPYPPGVPVLCPGEQISIEHVQMLRTYLDKGHKILGIRENRIRILTV